MRAEGVKRGQALKSLSLSALIRPYGQRRQRDFFVRHLLGVEPRAN